MLGEREEQITTIARKNFITKAILKKLKKQELKAIDKEKNSREIRTF